MWWILPSDAGIRNVSLTGATTRRPGQLGLRDDGERGMHFVPIDGELAVGGCGDDAVLRSTIKAAPQVISGEAGLDALLDADAIRREGHGIAVVAGERIDIGIGRRDAVGF